MGKIKDLTGQKFDKLTVIEMLPNYKGDKAIYCKCICECGNIVIRRNKTLTAKGGHSCGCVVKQSKSALKTRKDFTGQKFGHLTVVEMLYGYGEHHLSHCRCICECGNERIISTYGLRHRSYPASCGCMDKYYQQQRGANCHKDYTGMRFGRLTVENMIYQYGKRTYAHCICDCGNTIDVIASSLTRTDGGQTLSCGCLQRERATEACTKDFTGHVFESGVVALRPGYQSKSGAWMWVCRCPHCNSEFMALPAKLNDKHIASCGCLKKSSGETMISGILDEMNIEYHTEYSFDDCCNILPLRFDFYIPKHNTLIEYQGQQHYASIEYWGGDEAFELRQHNDQIKRDYCETHHINLIEIPYTMNFTEVYNNLQTSFIRRDCNG